MEWSGISRIFGGEIMPFDPNKPYEVVGAKPSGFDPNKQFEQVDEPVDIPQNISGEKVYEDPMGTGESYLRGGAQGLTSDFADEIAARVMSMIQGTPYKDERTKQRQQFRTAQEQNPISYGAGQFTGGAVQGAALTAVPGGIPARLAASTALGGLQGYGASEAETLGEAAPDIRRGMGVGLGAGLFGESLPALAQGSRSFAVNRASGALGAERSTIKSMGPKKVQEAGAMALQEGTFGPFTQTGGMQTRNQSMLDRAWEGMKDVFNQIDSTGKSYFSPWEAAVNFEKKAGQFDRRLPINQSKVRTFERNLDSILQKGGENGENITFADAMSLKSDLDDLAKWKSQEKITVQEQMARDAYHSVNAAIDSAVDRASQELGNTDLGKQLIDSRKMYAAGKTAQKLLDNRYAREQGNKMGTGLTNTLVGAPALMASIGTGDPRYMGVLAAKIGYEKFGQQTMARSANALANILEASPEVFGQYAPAMLGALQKGGQSLAVQHYIMSQKDPAYVEAVKRALEEGEKKKIETPRYGGLGADVGNMIDNATWADKVGLDPQEQQQSGFQYGEGVPQPASIKPFAFKKIFPSKSAVGSEVKILPRIHGFGGVHPRGGNSSTYRDIIENNEKRRLYNDEMTPAESVTTRKRALQRGENFLDPSLAKHDVLDTEGAVFPDNKGVPQYSFARTPQASKHEHIHNQIEGLNRIEPNAARAMDNHFREKAKLYDIDVDNIVKKMHGQKEFMAVIGDILEEEPRRKDFFGKDNAWSRRQIQNLRRFYTDTATEIQSMSADDVKRIADDYNKNNISRILAKFGIKEK